MIEHSTHFLRARDVQGLEVRGTTLRSAEEVRHLLREHPGVPPAIDIRLIGCPEVFFERFLTRRQNQIEHEKRRAKARLQGEIIAADKGRK
jgi:hypothetical protein